MINEYKSGITNQTFNAYFCLKVISLIGGVPQADVI